jgi:deoxyribonucleoside regulator
MYYREGLTRESIADRLDIDRRIVTRMLEQAVELGVVRIDIPETVSDCGPAHELQEKFPHLKEIVVVPSLDDDYEQLLPRWGVAAATYFDKLVCEADELHVGITGGESLFEFCEAVTTQRRENVHIHTTALVGRGRLLPTASHIDPLVNAALLWAKCGRISGHIHYATVPPYDGLTRDQIGKELDDLAKRQPIRAIIEDMDRIDVAFAGLGLVRPILQHGEEGLVSKITMTGLLQPMVTPEQLAGEGAVAELSNCFFDARGNGDRWNFFLTAGHYDPARRGVEFFRRMVKDGKTVIVIAGERKIEAIKVALKAQLFNVWITDYETLYKIAKPTPKNATE